MKVGVAIPVHNERDRIELALASVRMQTHRASAYLALDGCTDGTDVLLDCRRDQWHTRRVVSPHRRGWPSALNAAAALALSDGCEAVVVMNGDDYLDPMAVEHLVHPMVKAKADWALGYGKAVGEANAVQMPLAEFPLKLADFAGTHCPIVPVALIRAEMWQALDGYDPGASLYASWGYCEDWDFWIRSLKARFRGILVREITHYQVMHAKQLHRATVHRHVEARARIAARHPDVFGADNDRFS